MFTGLTDRFHTRVTRHPNGKGFKVDFRPWWFPFWSTAWYWRWGRFCPPYSAIEIPGYSYVRTDYIFEQSDAAITFAQLLKARGRFVPIYVGGPKAKEWQVFTTEKNQ